MSIKNVVFGSQISEQVRKKLTARQVLASNPDINESIQQRYDLDESFDIFEALG